MSVGAAYLCHATGKVWFEVDVLEPGGSLRVGFAGTSFRGTTVGDDAASWAVIASWAVNSYYHGYALSPPPLRHNGMDLLPATRRLEPRSLARTRAN